MRVYDLAVGDVFSAYGCNFACGEKYRVESIAFDVAVCRQDESGSLLMLPLNVPMPFAVRVYKAKAGAEERTETQAEVMAEAPQPERQEAESEEEKQPARIESVIDFYRPVENWGKIHAEGMRSGIFFHITQVEDEELRSFLAGLSFGAQVPSLKISYVRSCNPQRNNALCAGAIRAEEALPEAVAVGAAETETHHGFISEQESSGVLTLMEDGREYRTNLHTKIDPGLKAYLAGYATAGSLDPQDLEADFTTAGRTVTRVEWTNRAEKDVSLEVSDEEKAEWEQTEDEPEQKAVTVPAYRALPVWRANYGMK